MKNSQGYTLLFAIIITSLVLSVSLSIIGIARKEILLSSAATESQVAIFTADTGIECARYWDSQGKFSAFTTSNITIKCNAPGYPPDSDAPYNVTVGPAAGDASKYDFTFVIPFSSLGSNNENRCAAVSVFKELITNSTIVKTTIISKGYNVGYHQGTQDSGDPQSCDNPSAQKVERALEYYY